MTPQERQAEIACIREFAIKKYEGTSLSVEERILLELYEHSFATSPEPEHNGTTSVFDAECEDVATCADPAMARLIARLLSTWFAKHWRP